MAARSLIFAEPVWFLALPAVALGGAALWFLSRAVTRRRVGAFLSAARLPEVLALVDWRARRWRFLVPAGIIALLAVVLARPLTGPKPGSDEHRGADLVIALDVSKSMWAEDVAPNRLDAVKEALASWIRNQGTDRIGLVLFAGEAFVQAPLTHDATALEFVLNEATPDSISQGGSSIPKAIETAAGMLGKKDRESRVLLIVSDGENLDGDSIAAARAARQNDGLTISTVGVGTAAGAKVPSFDKKREKGPRPNQGPFVRSEYGADVVSRLDSQALRAIATVGGGSYFDFAPEDHFFARVRDRIITPLMQKTRKIDAKNYDEWFQIPLGLAILLMTLEPILGRSRRRTAAQGTGVPVVKPANLSRTARATAVSLLVLLATSGQGWASPDRNEESALTREIERQFAAGKPDEAIAAMKAWAEKNPTDPHAAYNYALTLYRAGRYDESQTVFEAAGSLADDPALKARTLFQMGNIQVRIGRELRERNDAKLGAVRAFEQALGNYDAQLALDGDAAARHNRDLASAQLETLLLEIGTERTRANTEKTLREAMQAFERAAELNEKHRPLAARAREQLKAALASNAEKLDAEADANEAKATELSEKTFRKLLEARQEIVNRYQEAQSLAPEDQAVAAALAKQTEKMANLLTKAAAEQAAPGLEEKRFYSSGNLRALQGATEKLGQALSLSPEHTAAKDLNARVNAALVDAHVQNGELALGHLRKSLASEEAAAAGGETKPEKKAGKSKSQDEKQLKDAQTAAESFQSALTLAPDHEQAKAGLAEAQGVLAQLHADVGLSDLSEAEAKMDAAGADSAAGKPPGEQSDEAAPQPGEGAGEGAADGREKGPAPSGKQAAQLRSAAALLEKATSNLGAAAGMQPQNTGYAEGLAKAENLLSGVREKLDAIQTAEASAAAEGSAPGEGQEAGEGEGQAGQVNEKNGPSEMKSMSALRGKAGGGGAGGGDSKRYWNRFVKDW